MMSGLLGLLLLWLSAGGSQLASASFLDSLSFSNLNLWPQRRFQTEGLVDAGSLGLDKARGMVAAVGDVNGDQVYAIS